MQHDPAFNDTDLDRAAVETVGRMTHDLQGIAPTDHNSGDIASVGPLDGSMHHHSGMGNTPAGGGYDPES